MRYAKTPNISKTSLPRDHKAPVWDGWVSEEFDQPRSKHAKKRQIQRNIPTWVFAAAQRFGRYKHQQGALCCFFGKRAVEDARKATGQDLSRYEGLHLIYTPDGTSLMTVYRNKSPKRPVSRGRSTLEQEREPSRRQRLKI